MTMEKKHGGMFHRRPSIWERLHWWLAARGRR